MRAAFAGKEPFEGNCRKFLPLSKLRQFVKHDTVLEHLQTCHSQAVNSLLEDHPLYGESDKCSAVAHYICGTSNGENGEAENNDAAKKIFAILLTIEKEPAILDFVQAGIKDKDLPFRKIDESGLDFNLSMKDEELSLPIFSEWSHLEKEGFEAKQWAMLSPILEPGTDKKFNHYVFEKELILPFVAADELDTHRGHNSKVWEVVIDEDHHGFPGVCTQPCVLLDAYHTSPGFEPRI